MSPTTCSITQSLVPIFSSSRAAMFQDILYPSTWYWLKLVYQEYDEDDDMDWSAKKNVLYWTGSATGGYATSDNWRDLHRQRFVLRMKEQNTSATILQRSYESLEDIWHEKIVPMSNNSHLFDLRITAIPRDQCEAEACQIMRDTFLKNPSTNKRIVNHPDSKNVGRGNDPNIDPLDRAYTAKHVLDLDGNGFSGRFYRLLLSQSCVLKQTIFQEWHDRRLLPWVHFIPVSTSGDELPEIMRFLTQEEVGRRIGADIARQGREWAARTLRMVDLELVFLRVLMEYGRIIDDERDRLGFRLGHVSNDSD
jgi:hypothetical protein